jgi:CheY-like chemotaxis protein
MPIMSGWDFLNAFHELNIEIKNNVKIYMLSSSINDEDISIAKSNKYVIDYLMKPLQISKLKELFT